MAFQRGEFESADAYIAFLGMDLRVSDSGQMNGRRSLSKKGDSEIRRLLAKGLKTTQALLIIARKLARIAFSLMKNQSEYQSKAVSGASTQP